MTTPNRPPLWEVMEKSCGTVANWDDVIRALRDWLIQQCRHEGIDQDARNSIYKMLTAEADRLERNDA